MADSNALSALYDTYPDELKRLIDRAMERIGVHPSIRVKDWSTTFRESLVQAFSRSHFVRESCTRYPDWLQEWSLPDSNLYSCRPESAQRQALLAMLSDADSESDLMSALRLFRTREMTRLIWRDITGLAGLTDTLSEVTALADVCISVALEFLYRQLCEKYGVPRSLASTGRKRQELLVLGMGKLGARELNVSSDIDLIFAYPEAGETDHPDKPIENQQFFNKLGQRLIHALNHVNGEGFVFRVDMRLRPYGSAGALALNFSAFEDYYQNQGREWERFAMVKARIITGEPEQQDMLLNIITPFVYRGYTDFSSIQALRDMKRLIMSEVHRKGGEQNIKLGTGGIREIEFIVQACQLIHGGRDLDLQQPGLLPVLTLLKQRQYLPAEWVDRLVAANAFLRNMEHAIQGLRDQQTQLIPGSELERAQVAWSLGQEAWVHAERVMREHRQHVNQIFLAFLEEDAAEPLGDLEDTDEWLQLWRSDAGEDVWIKTLQAHSFEDPQACLQAIEELRHSRLYRAMSADAVSRLEHFMPMLFQAAAQMKYPARTFVRILQLVREILGRTIYLVLLYENPNALLALCALCQDSPWVSEHLAKSPVILEELLDARSLYQPPDRASLQDELRQVLLRIPEDDLETQMDALRHFKQSHMLRVAAAELSGKLPLMKVSDYLTWLAEALIARCVTISWRYMFEKYGLPGGFSDAEVQSGFAVIGYGKLGGIELNYNSDLDMVFLYRCDENGMTQGKRSINNQVFFTRLGQRIIHLLSTHTTQGDLYEVDMRLRPSGNSGMLVSSMDGFAKYQRENAWTWEHQALVRARYVAGDPSVAEAFEAIRSAVLGQFRDRETLRQEVREMRSKMRVAAETKFKSSSQAAEDIKLGAGGLVDIEFITQFGVLQGAHAQPELLAWTDNVRLLEAIESLGCFPSVNIPALIDAYRDLRSALHRKSLADEHYQVFLSEFPEQREVVRQAWRNIFEVSAESD